MNPLPECCIPHSAPIPHQFVMKVYVDAWIYVTEKFVNMGNIELYEGVLRYEKADYPPIPNFIFSISPLNVLIVRSFFSMNYIISKLFCIPLVYLSPLFSAIRFPVHRKSLKTIIRISP